MIEEADVRHAVESVERHPAVRQVCVVGSRASGTATALSDWDFHVDTDDFPALVHDIGSLVERLHPLAQQWDRLSETYCWMVIVPGPVKLDFMFDEPHEQEPPWAPASGNLGSIDQHFWDWTLWLGSKQAKGASSLVLDELSKMFEHLLRPIGVEQAPNALGEAITDYLTARTSLERAFHIEVPRTLGREVVRALGIGRGTR